MPAVVLRDAVPADLPDIGRIYAHDVRTSVVTFELEPPSLKELENRYARIKNRALPYLVACVSDRVVGYASCSPYRDRPAYRHTVEDSIYLDSAHLG